MATTDNSANRMLGRFPRGYVYPKLSGAGMVLSSIRRFMKGIGVQGLTCPGCGDGGGEDGAVSGEERR